MGARVRPQPAVAITFQTEGLQWGTAWDISALLALPRRFPALKSRYTVDQDTGQACLYLTCGKVRAGHGVVADRQRSSQKDEYEAAIATALKATPCVLCVQGSGGWQAITSGVRSRGKPASTVDLYAEQIEFGENDGFIYEHLLAWQSECRLCPKVHDRDHQCCRLACAQTASTGLYDDERPAQGKVSDACALERMQNSLKWPVPGSDDFSEDFYRWFGKARRLGVLQRNNELKRRVNAGVFSVLYSAKILLCAQSARLPPEVMRKVVEYTCPSVLTVAQFDKLLTHAVDGEERRRVAAIFCAAARTRTPRVSAEVFGENRRLVLRDEWLWNGGFVWSRSYRSAQRELGYLLPHGDVGSWPPMEDRDAVLRFLWFAPAFHAAWPYDNEGRRIKVVPYTNPDLYPPWPKAGAARDVFCTIESHAPCLSSYIQVFSDGEEEPLLWQKGHAENPDTDSSAYSSDAEAS